MEIDTEQLRRHYSSLTDEALLAIDRGELVSEARSCHDEELRRRSIPIPKTAATAPPDPGEPWIPEENPDWVESGMVAMAADDRNRGPVFDARTYLTRAGIPNHIVQRSGDAPDQPPIYELLVPPGRHLLALSVLDRDYFNPQLVADWEAHFSSLSDDELMEIEAEDLVAGMRDRIDRLVRAYEDELLKRGLAELETGSPE